MKQLILYLSLVLMTFAAANTRDNTGSRVKQKNYYIGTNPVSYIATLRVQDDIKRNIPEVSGLEYGFSVVTGYFASPKLLPEARFSMGNIHRLARVWQIHAGVNYFPFKQFERWFSAFYVGGFCKFWNLHNRLTKINFYNIAPYMTFGYFLEKRGLFYDIRLNQTIAVYSWSDLEHSSAEMDWFFSPWPAFIPVMPSLTFTFGWKY